MNIHDISFTSLGLVVLDEIRLPHKNPLTDILGGSGAYGWMIHVGNDFPKPIEDRLQSWDVTLVIERESDEPSTRGLLEYKDTTFGRATYFSSLKLIEPLPYCRQTLLIINLVDVLSTT
ncbi:unnamed protein product [Aspergillus oryzae RIB40]|uniref:DNA, SC023 n=1 Tax=Aspergillus oryzae (strain ATCC 42149 / RIB 40) TaxID=510516 RepID=Q2UHH8_ASPOR|nr:unnamed protein product [Aspergillus oryzae RIB40]BAE58987.1 unnamed protein product [Aspergillus oryzae RIB40]